MGRWVLWRGGAVRKEENNAAENIEAFLQAPMELLAFSVRRSTNCVNRGDSGNDNDLCTGVVGFVVYIVNFS